MKFETGQTSSNNFLLAKNVASVCTGLICCVSTFKGEFQTSIVIFSILRD